MNTNRTADYRSLLRDELAKRCNKIPRYSLRSFARDLEISPSRLSHVLNGRYGLSPQAAKEICEKIKWTSSESEFFCALVESTHARSTEQKKRAKQKVQKSLWSYRPLEADTFKTVSEWYTLPILELVALKDFSENPNWIAKKLGITEHEAKSSVSRLLRLGLLSQGKDLKYKAEAVMVNREEVPARAVQDCHAQLLDQAKIALYEQSVTERHFSHLSIAIDPEDLPLMKEMIHEFRVKVDKTFSNRPERSRVYGLNVQLFEFTKSNKSKSVQTSHSTKKGK
jgi:uncharacterized protein (TIGR02147 family)